MKKLILITLLASPLAFAAPTAFQVKTDTSTLTWLGKKVGGQHEGTIQIKSGTLNFEGTKPVNATIIVDMPTLKVTDITDEGMNKKLTGHLSSPDFFATQEFKEAKIDIKSVKMTTKDNYELVGDLTIKNITQPITFNSQITTDAKSGMAMAMGKLTVDRTLFGIKFKSGKFFQNLGDKLIYDTFDISFNLKAQK